MRWSWKIGRLFGIAVFVHATFPLILIWVAVGYYDHGGIVAALNGVVLMLCVFGIVVMHELGHALTARRYGIETRDIILLPIGGVARFERLPEEPRQELVIAVAGPAVNAVLALLIAAVLWAANRPLALIPFGSPEGTFLHSMLWVNVFLILFNALPAFPMDGGRVLRAVLAMRMDYAKATQIAAGIGKGFALLFGLVGVMTNPFLIIIAFFVWVGASGEASLVRFRSDLGGALAEEVMIRDVLTLSPDDPLERGVENVLAGFQPDFPVLESGTLVGLLTREDLLKALSSRGRSGAVRDAMRTEFPTAALDDPVEEAFTRLQKAGMRTIPVVAGRSFQGVVTMENIAEFLMVRAALKGKGA